MLVTACSFNAVLISFRKNKGKELHFGFDNEEDKPFIFYKCILGVKSVLSKMRFHMVLLLKWM